MSLLTTLDTNTNFWKMNPQFKLREPYKTYWKSDRSTGKKDSSRFMWAVALLHDPSDANTFRNIPIDERRDLISRDFLKNSKYDWDKRKEIVEAFKNESISQAAKALVVWEEIIMIREEKLLQKYKSALKNDIVDVKYVDELDKLLARTPKFYEDYGRINKAFIEERDAIARGTGNKPKSLSDGKEI